MTRDEAIAVLQEEIDGNLELTLREWKERDEQSLFPALRMAIEALQTLEAVERIKTEVLPQTDLVRCKDCRWQHTSRKSGRQICAHQNGLVYAADDSFCSQAERRLK